MKHLGGGAKNSFFAGHVALVATSTFFTAKVFADYHPDSKLRHLLYGVAIASTAGTGLFTSPWLANIFHQI